MAASDGLPGTAAFGQVTSGDTGAGEEQDRAAGTRHAALANPHLLELDGPELRAADAVRFRDKLGQIDVTPEEVAVLDGVWALNSNGHPAARSPSGVRAE